MTTSNEISDLCKAMPLILSKELERIVESAKMFEQTPSKYTKDNLLTHIYIAFTIISDVRSAVVNFDAGENA